MASESGASSSGDSSQHYSPSLDDHDFMRLLDNEIQPDKSLNHIPGTHDECVFEQENEEAPTSISSDQLRALFDEDSQNNPEGSKQARTSSRPKDSVPSIISTDIRVKQESPGFEIMAENFVGGETIDLCDSDDEPVLNNYHRTGEMMQGSIIELSDGEDIRIPSVVKTEPPEKEQRRPFQASVESGEKSESSSRPILGIFRLKSRQQPQSHMKVAQNPRVATGAGKIFKAPQTPPPSSMRAPNGKDLVSKDDTVVEDNEPAIDFKALKKAYCAKRKAHENTLEDDVHFKRAQIEQDRIARMQVLDMARGDSSDEAEDSEDGLFVPDSSLHDTTNKHFPTLMDDDDTDAGDDNGATFTASHAAKDAPPKKTVKKPANQPELSTKQSRAKALKQELLSNMMAGIEPILLRDQERTEEQEAEAIQAEARGKNHPKKRKTNLIGNPSKRAKTGRMNTVSSLMNSNIYDDSNANLDKSALPQMNEKRKKEFLTSLVASIPIEDQKQAITDKNALDKATRVLGPRQVVSDGKGDWIFKDKLKTSLRHFQVLGAGYMKSRELGGNHPYGGILAGELSKHLLPSMSLRTWN